jgi:hypothetical protein
MARKTLGSIYHASDIANFKKRQLLCYKSDARDIYYISDPAQADPQSPTTPAADTALLMPKNVVVPAVSVNSANESKSNSNSNARTVVAVPDVAVTAAEIIRSIIPATTKNPLSENQLKNSIKELAAGLSPPFPELTSRSSPQSVHKTDTV